MYGLKKRVLCLVLALCLIIASAATAGSSVGSKSSSVTPSSTKVFIKLTKSVTIFTGDKYGSGTTAVLAAGAVLQLVSDNYYTASDGRAYYSLYYKNNRFNVLLGDVENDIMSAEALNSYVVNTIWKSSATSALRLNTVGSVDVYALQKALQTLGFYSGTLDGNYGTGTAAAVKAFQKANSLTADGVAGTLTLPLIYSKASNSGSGSGGGETPSIGTLTTTVSVNLRKSASKSSALLTVVPAKISLDYTKTATAGGSTWYYVTYNSRSGWLMGNYVNIGGNGGSGSSATTGTLRTIASVNMRQGHSTSSAKLTVIPKGATLSFTNKTTVNGINWYNITYNSMKGWVMGTYITVIASGSNGSGSGSTSIGTVKITKTSTHVRKAPNGEKSGVVLAKGVTVDLLADAVQSGGYDWYCIRTASGLVGYVRGDCCTVTSGGSSGGESSGGSGSGSSVIVDSGNNFVKLTKNVNLYTTETKSSTAAAMAPAGTVIKMVSSETYTSGGVTYASVYYNSKRYNCVYSDISSGIMSASELTAYINNLYNSNMTTAIKASLKLKGDVRVYALQEALKKLGYFTGTPSGNFDTATDTAVRNFQRSVNLTVDGSCGKNTWSAIAKKLNGGSGSGSGTVVANFGTVNKVVKATWTSSDNGGSLFPKGSYATVMDVATGKVFSVYRWSGGTHADCVPSTSSDTKTMCDIVGFTYNSKSPTSTQLAKIKADGNSGSVTYTWPDFKGAFGGTAKNIGSAWDRRAALLNVNGTVYCVSIYGFPHGFNGTDAFSKSKFPSGKYFYEVNNYYGMMCIHFVGSTTHSSSTPDSQHQANITKAYDYAKKLWPTLCK